MASCEGEGFKRVKVEKFEVGKVRSWKRSKLEKIDVTKVRSWKCSKIIINVAYTNRPCFGINPTSGWCASTVTVCFVCAWKQACVGD